MLFILVSKNSFMGILDFEDNIPNFTSRRTTEILPWLVQLAKASTLTFHVSTPPTLHRPQNAPSRCHKRRSKSKTLRHGEWKGPIFSFVQQSLIC